MTQVKKISHPPQVVLIVPPYFPSFMPSIGCSILKASLENIRIRCRVYYGNVRLEDFLDRELYLRLANLSMEDLVFERLFSVFAHDEIKSLNLNMNEGKKNGLPLIRLTDESLAPLSQKEVSKLHTQCRVFLETIDREISSLKPKIIGFSSSAEQTNASIAMARRLKKILPSSLFVLGGNICDGAMGEELASSIEVFDYLFQGEADVAFAEFCRDYIQRGVLPSKKLIPCRSPQNLDTIPIPDYQDFFEQISKGNSKDAYEGKWLPYESSRGCWWGQKHQCRFCGESELDLGFRAKSPERLLEEFRILGEKYKVVHNFFATDNIVPQGYFKNFFPKLAKSDYKKNIRLMPKPNITFSQIKVMKQAGVIGFLPGIESLSTRLLVLLNKGCNAVLNIRFLRNCRELDIMSLWNFFVCIPGDRASDYEEQRRLFPYLQHLSPPGIISPLRIERFSPFFEESEKFGLTEITPYEGYKHAYPASIDIESLAFFFDAKFPSESKEQPEILIPLIEDWRKWVNRWLKREEPSLRIKSRQKREWIVEDTRDCAQTKETAIDQEEYSLLCGCRNGKCRNSLKCSRPSDRLLERGFLVEVDDKLLSVVCDESPQGPSS